MSDQNKTSAYTVILLENKTHLRQRHFKTYNFDEYPLVASQLPGINLFFIVHIAIKTWELLPEEKFKILT